MVYNGHCTRAENSNSNHNNNIKMPTQYTAGCSHSEQAYHTTQHLNNKAVNALISLLSSQSGTSLALKAAPLHRQWFLS